MITAFAGTVKRASDPAGLRIGTPELASGVSRHQNRFDEAVQPVQVDVGQARGELRLSVLSPAAGTPRGTPRASSRACGADAIRRTPGTIDRRGGTAPCPRTRRRRVGRAGRNIRCHSIRQPVGAEGAERAAVIVTLHVPLERSFQPERPATCRRREAERARRAWRLGIGNDRSRLPSSFASLGNGRVAEYGCL